MLLDFGGGGGGMKSAAGRASAQSAPGAEVFNAVRSAGAVPDRFLGVCRLSEIEPETAVAPAWAGPGILS